MEIYVEYLKELLWLNDAIIKEYKNIKELENKNIYVSFDNFVYPASYVIDKIICLISKMQERKLYLEEIFKNLNKDMLYSLYEYISTIDMGKEKIDLICYLFELINNLDERGR